MENGPLEDVFPIKTKNIPLGGRWLYYLPKYVKMIRNPSLKQKNYTFHRIHPYLIVRPWFFLFFCGGKLAVSNALVFLWVRSGGRNRPEPSPFGLALGEILGRTNVYYPNPEGAKPWSFVSRPYGVEPWKRWKQRQPSLVGKSGDPKKNKQLGQAVWIFVTYTYIYGDYICIPRLDLS